METVQFCPNGRTLDAQLTSHQRLALTRSRDLFVADMASLPSEDPMNTHSPVARVVRATIDGFRDPNVGNSLLPMAPLLDALMHACVDDLTKRESPFRQVDLQFRLRPSVCVAGGAHATLEGIMTARTANPDYAIWKRVVPAPQVAIAFPEWTHPVVTALLAGRDVPHLPMTRPATFCVRMLTEVTAHQRVALAGAAARLLDPAIAL